MRRPIPGYRGLLMISVDRVSFRRPPRDAYAAVVPAIEDWWSVMLPPLEMQLTALVRGC